MSNDVIEGKGDELAFPGEGWLGNPGLTKREYAAIEAMHGLVVAGFGSSDAAKMAVQYADSLIEELSK